MTDNFKTELDAIRAETPLKVRADPGGLLYGAMFVALGVWLLDLGAEGFGAVLILVGAIGVIAGVATFVSDSPGVKIVQAGDSFLMALVLGGLALSGADSAPFENPLIAFGMAAFMLWAGYDDLREYTQLREALAERAKGA